jgi:agmatinase
MADISNFDPNSIGNPDNNIFGLPFTQDDAELILIPVPWEVTVSYGAGTARAANHIFDASLQVDLFDPDFPNEWKKGFFMQEVDKKLLQKSDYLRKEAELYLDFICNGGKVSDNQFLSKNLTDINEGSKFMNQWVYEKTSEVLVNNKKVGLIGGDHSTPLGFFKAIAEKFGEFGILQIDAHCDLRKAFEDFTYSHASIMYNALEEIPQINKLVQVGIRDYCEEEWNYINNSKERIVTYFDKSLKERLYEGEIWKNIVHEIVENLPNQVFISFDIDGLDPKLCPYTGTPVQGGFETEQVFYLFKQVLKSGRKIIGFDLNEVGVGENDWDANVGARVLFKLCNLLNNSNH